MDTLKLLSNKQMYNTYDFIPEKRTYEDIELDLQPLLNNPNIYKIQLQHIGDWVFNARLYINFDCIEPIECPDIIKLIDIIILEIGATTFEIIRGQFLDLLYKTMCLNTMWISPVLILPLGLNLLSCFNGIPLCKINSKYQNVKIIVKFTENYKIKDVSCYLKYYNITPFSLKNTIYNKPLALDYVNNFLSDNPISDDFFASNFIYYEYYDFDLRGFFFEQFTLNFNLYGSKIFWCLTNELGNVVTEQFFQIVRLSIQGNDIFVLKYPLIKHSCVSLPLGYYLIDFEDIVHFSRININDMKLTFHMVENYAKYSGYKLNICVQQYNCIYYKEGIAQILWRC